MSLQSSANHQACTLPYPDRFHAAVNFIVNNTPGIFGRLCILFCLSGHTRLLYELFLDILELAILRARIVCHKDSLPLFAGSKPIPDELRLVLYALHQQATVGPCTEAKPWGWNVVESAKWESWNQLGNMSSVEAMRLYVKMVEDDQVGRLQCYCL